MLRHSLWSLILMGSLTLLASQPRDVNAQGANPPPTVPGTITGLETKGRTTLLTFTDEGGNVHEFALTPKVDLEIVATGDDGFLAPGMFIVADAVVSNDYLFASNIKVYPQNTGRVAPAKAIPAPPIPGRSQNAHIVTGEVVRLDDKGDGKYDTLQLKLNAKSEMPMYIEPNHKVSVVLTDPSQIEVGQSASVMGRQAGTRLIAIKITVNTGKSLKGAEFLPTLEQKKN